MPDFVIHVHLNQHIAGIEHPLNRILFAVANLRHGFGWNQNAANLLF